MSVRSWPEREAARRARKESGYTMIRVTRTTARLIRTLRTELAHETRSDDEMLYEVVLKALADLRDRRGVQ